MNRTSAEAVGLRYTGWAALNRDPQEDRLEFTCPHCGAHGTRRPGVRARPIISPTVSFRISRARWEFAGVASSRSALFQ